MSKFLHDSDLDIFFEKSRPNEGVYNEPPLVYLIFHYSFNKSFFLQQTLSIFVNVKVKKIEVPYS